MRFPSFEPQGEPQEPKHSEIKKDGFALIPSEARKKILRVLQSDLLKRGAHLPKDIKRDTLSNVIAMEEQEAKVEHGELVSTEHMHYSTPPEGPQKELDIEEGWAAA
jgi:hypothetical protein